MSAAQIDGEVKALLEQHSYLQVVEAGEGDQKRVRVRCDLTQHELLPRKDAIETYLKTKKFLKAKEWYCYDYSKYEPYIVEHRRKPKSLYCNVTGTILNRIPAEVEKHVKGKKFQRLKDHVSFTRHDGDNEEELDFDANAFEFENQQLIYSDEEEEEEGKPRKKRGSDDDDDEEDDENEDEDDDEEEEEGSDSGEEDDVMAEFYPLEDEEEDEDEHIREAVKRLTMKRKASTDETNENASPAPKAKKQKASDAKSTKSKTEKPAKSAKAAKQKKNGKK